jgi:hypothetical protein
MLTGSFASGIHGQPRASHDINFVIAPTLGSLDQLLRSLPEETYYVSREAALDAYGREALFKRGRPGVRLEDRPHLPKIARV